MQPVGYSQVMVIYYECGYIGVTVNRGLGKSWLQRPIARWPSQGQDRR
jgi:hypothetical protein